MIYRRQRLADLRKAAGYTQERLAEELGVERSTVVRWERAETEPQPWHRPRLSRLLGISRNALADVLADVVAVEHRSGRQPRNTSVPSAVRGVPFALDSLRTAIASYPLLDGTSDKQPRPLDEIETMVSALHAAYQRANYSALMPLLPSLLADLNAAVATAVGVQRLRAYRLLACSHVLASKLASKAGDGELARLTADRAAAAAGIAGARALGAVAVYQVACAFFTNPTSCGQAEALAGSAAEDLAQSPRNDLDLLSARGSLLLLAALAAARRRDRHQADRRLAEAASLAEQLGKDQNRLWTGFGPTNVRIHGVSVAVELDQLDKASAVGEQLDMSRLPATLVSRRAQIHVDLATASARQPSGDAFAVLHLLEVERAAPQVLQVNASARAVLHALLSRERQRLTPGLRPLAQRAGGLA